MTEARLAAVPSDHEAVALAHARNYAAGNIMTGAPLVTLHVLGPLRAYCAGRSELSLSGASVRAVLEELERTHAALHRNICDETGRVRKHLNVFVNATHVRDLAGLDTPVKVGDVVSVLPAVSGG